MIHLIFLAAEAHAGPLATLSAGVPIARTPTLTVRPDAGPSYTESRGPIDGSVQVRTAFANVGRSYTIAQITGRAREAHWRADDGKRPDELLTQQRLEAELGLMGVGARWSRGEAAIAPYGVVACGLALSRSNIFSHLDPGGVFSGTGGVFLGRGPVAPIAQVRVSASLSSYSYLRTYSGPALGYQWRPTELAATFEVGARIGGHARRLKADP